MSISVPSLRDLNIIKGSVTKSIILACSWARSLFARNWKEKRKLSQQAHSQGMADFTLIPESLGTNILLDLDNIRDFGEHIKLPPAQKWVAVLDGYYTILICDFC